MSCEIRVKWNSTGSGAGTEVYGITNIANLDLVANTCRRIARKIPGNWTAVTKFEVFDINGDRHYHGSGAIFKALFQSNGEEF